MSNYKGFSTVKLRRPQKSAFDLGADKRLTTRMGRLTPVLVQECVPSDSFRITTEMLVRLAPLLAPIFDQIYVYVHFYFTPCRLLWSEWETFITGGRLGVGVDPVSAPIPPYFNVGETMAVNPGLLQKSSLADYFSLPIFEETDSNPASWNHLNLNAMPFLAYQLINMEYYRDRNFVADDALGFDYPLPSGDAFTLAQAEELLTLRVRNYTHDYFTSALPFTQRGEEVLMPVELGGIAPLYVNSLGGTGVQLKGEETPGPINTQYAVQLGTEGPEGSLWVNGEDFDGTSTSINDFRSAYALQVWLERNAIGGSRYTESTEAHFGVKPQDSRLQRPEYIGGGMVPIKISEVVATAWSQNVESANIPQGNMAGHGVTYGNTNRAGYFCTEHGYIIGILSIMSPPSYQQGLPRMFLRNSFLDWPWPTFAKLGEQEVYDYEIWADPVSTSNYPGEGYNVFGYQSRYADWKSSFNTNHGDFRDNLLFWTLTRIFDDQPILSEAFNRFDDTVQNRIFANPAFDSFWIYLHNYVDVKRPLPYFGTPNNLGFE